MRDLIFFIASLAILVSSLPSQAQDRSKFAVEFNIGPNIPLTNYIQDRTILILDDNFPRIVDVSNKATLLNGTLTLDIRDVELSFSFRQFAWGQFLASYKGNDIARQSTNGNIDDANIVYEPLNNSEPPGDFNDLIISDSLELYTLTIGKRIYLLENKHFSSYVPIATGLAVTSTSQAEDSKTGISFVGGIASDVSLNDSIALTVDGRLHCILTENASGVSQSVRNANITNTSIFGTLVSSLVFASVSVGIRFDADEIFATLL